MSRAKKYFQNAILLSLSALLMRSVSVAFNVYVTGKVGAEGMGLLTLIGSAYGFAVTFATSGVSLAVTRLCAETVVTAPHGESVRRLKNVAVTAAVYAAFFGGVGGGVLYLGAEEIASRLLGDVRTAASLRILALTLVPVSASSALSGYFNACRRVYKNAAAEVAGQALKIGVTAAAFGSLLPGGAENALLAVALGSLASEVGSTLMLAVLWLHDKRKYYGGKTAGRSADSRVCGTEMRADTVGEAGRSLCCAALPVALSAHVRSGLVTLEHILIPRGLEKSGAPYETALASYGTLHGMVMPVILFPYAILGSFSSLLVPELSICRAKGEVERIRHISRLVFRATLIFAVGTSGILMTFSGELGRALYGSDEAGDYIRILAPVIPVMYLDTAVDSMLKGLGKQLFCMRVNVIDAALSVLLVWGFVPRWGVGGYAAVIIISEVINASASIVKLLSVADVRAELGRWLFRPLAASALASATMRFLVNRVPRFYRAEGGLYVTLMIVAAASLYFAMLALTNTVGADDVVYIRSLFGKRERENR